MNRSCSRKRRLNQPSRPVAYGAVSSCAEGVELDSVDLDQLEELDNTIFAALDGDPAALDRSRQLWRTVQREVAAPLVEESQAQYAKRALMVWDATRSSPEQSLTRAFAALEVLGLMADE
ncbi:hypothetical protein NG895_13110 [Aeoliella sp. ICT_H6.2]|uniref:Uncharacterized protein n=1 Tax=Aeoliella straminimaris TaxID=2954799 RepID=A0A9X2JG96_9BACT|nr:hypothetical protein [Aeoliella straminimaris]MCO6044845.1 hypothetical protein [Aeoliella straminimaris]